MRSSERTSWRSCCSATRRRSRTTSRRNREFSRDAIDEYRAIGGTALYDALSESLLRMKCAEGRRVVVVMTDGRDENNAGTAPGSTADSTTSSDTSRTAARWCSLLGLAPT